MLPKAYYITMLQTRKNVCFNDSLKKQWTRSKRISCTSSLQIFIFSSIIAQTNSSVSQGVSPSISCRLKILIFSLLVYASNLMLQHFNCWTLLSFSTSSPLPVVWEHMLATRFLACADHWALIILLVAVIVEFIFCFPDSLICLA